MKRIAWLLLLLPVAACAGEQKNYAASARCQNLGLKSGTAEYDRCVKDEEMTQLMQQQREEYEQMKQLDQDWKMRRY